MSVEPYIADSAEGSPLERGEGCVTQKRTIIPYNSNLKELARKLRNNSTPGETKLWAYLKGKQFFGYDFHRQKPLLNYIVDFYCSELNLVIELDGRYHFTEEAVSKDGIRDGDFAKWDLNIIRFTETEVRDDIDNALRTIETYIIEHPSYKHTPNPSQEGNF